MWNFSLSCETTLYLWRLLCPMWDCYPTWECCPSWDCCLTWEYCPLWDCSVLYEVVLSHMRLLYPMWDCCLHEITLSHVRLLSHMRLFLMYFVTHKTLYIFLHEIALSHTRLLCPMWDCCPTWNYSVPCETAFLHETAVSHKIASTVFCNIQNPVFLYLFWTFIFWFDLLGTEFRDGTGQVGLGQS